MRDVRRALAVVRLGGGRGGRGRGFFALPPVLDSEEGGTPGNRVTIHRSWTPGDRRKLEDILVAESLRRPREMTGMLVRLRATQPRLAGLPMIEARAAAAASSFAEADAALARATREPGADRVALSFARAANSGNQRHLDEMRASLGDAIALDPTRAEFHFQRAEVDRRQGRVQESLAGFDRALVLAKPGLVPSRETIEFRRRLLLIERGREAELDAVAYQAAFAQPAPPPDWLLTAAALAEEQEAGALAAGRARGDALAGLRRANRRLLFPQPRERAGSEGSLPDPGRTRAISRFDAAHSDRSLSSGSGDRRSARRFSAWSAGTFPSSPPAGCSHSMKEMAETSAGIPSRFH